MAKCSKCRESLLPGATFCGQCGTPVSANDGDRALATVVIGRDPACDYVLDGAKISGRHCEMRFFVDSVEVRDLGSSNGTFVGLARDRIDRATTLSPATPLHLGPEPVALADVARKIGLRWPANSQIERTVLDERLDIPPQQAPTPLPPVTHAARRGAVHSGPRAETVFLEEQGVLVTNTRFTHEHNTFAMANVTSVSFAVDGWVLGAIALFLGVLCLAQGVEFLRMLGIVLVLLGALILALRRAHVVLRSAGGEQRALSSINRKFIARVVAAVNEAIVYRG